MCKCFATSAKYVLDTFYAQFYWFWCGQEETAKYDETRKRIAS